MADSGSEHSRSRSRQRSRSPSHERRRPQKRNSEMQLAIPRQPEPRPFMPLVPYGKFGNGKGKGKGKWFGKNDWSNDYNAWQYGTDFRQGMAVSEYHRDRFALGVSEPAPLMEGPRRKTRRSKKKKSAPVTDANVAINAVASIERIALSMAASSSSGPSSSSTAAVAPPPSQQTTSKKKRGQEKDEADSYTYTEESE